jgi:hypothetical protein
MKERHYNLEAAFYSKKLDRVIMNGLLSTSDKKLIDEIEAHLERRKYKDVFVNKGECEFNLNPTKDDIKEHKKEVKKEVAKKKKEDKKKKKEGNDSSRHKDEPVLTHEVVTLDDKDSDILSQLKNIK